MSFTTDRNDPRLGHGVDEKEIPQHEVYLILSEEERAKGFVRPVRDSYIHVGEKVQELVSGHPRELTEQEKNNHGNDYVAYGEYAKPKNSAVGRFFTKEDFDNFKNGYISGCGVLTKMSRPLAETYARDPKFYGATYCCGCNKHLSVNEFVWDGTEELVGS